MTAWWKSGVIYQIYPRSFADSDGDGIGDLAGIRSHLDHLVWLGVDGFWLSPIYRSPMADFGYDVSDYTDIDPVFGDLGTFDGLVSDARERGLRVMLDWVPNHTSDQHPWFLESRSSRTAAKRDWYVWRDGRDGGEPNNWVAAFGGKAWTWDEQTQQWYLHIFLPQQPDLNWANPDVEQAMHDVLRFWLDRGVDGFRADVVHLIGKDPALPDQPPERAIHSIVGVHDDPRAHQFLRRIRAVLDSYPGERAMVGEVNLGSAALLAPYYGHDDELNLVFNFTLLRAGWDAELWAALIQASEDALAPSGAWPVWVLGNHDTRRQRTRYGGSEARARTAAVVLLTLRGTPFLYAGEELGLLDAEIPPDRRVDPGRRDGCRAPLPWNGDSVHGWSGAEPWLPWAPEVDQRNVAALAAEGDSILHLYRRVLAARRASEALHSGSWRLLDGPEGTLVYERADTDDLRRIVANFNGETVEGVATSGEWTIEVATHRQREGRPWDGQLGPEDAVVLTPAARNRAR